MERIDVLRHFVPKGTVLYGVSKRLPSGIFRYRLFVARNQGLTRIDQLIPQDVLSELEMGFHNSDSTIEYNPSGLYFTTSGPKIPWEWVKHRLGAILWADDRAFTVCAL